MSDLQPPPVQLEYHHPRSPLDDPDDRSANARLTARAMALFGFVYGIASTVLMFFLAMIVSKSSADAFFWSMTAVLWGVPLICAFKFRACRAFALGLAIVVGIFLLLAGTCAIIFWNGI